MSVEAEQHIHQSAAALSAAPINRSTMSPVAPFSKIQHSTQLFCCSCLLPCVAMVTRSNSYPQSTTLPPRLPLVLMRTRSSKVRSLSFNHMHISAHMCTYKYAEGARVLQHASCCVQAILFSSNPLPYASFEIKTLLRCADPETGENRKTGQFLPQQIDRSED